MSGTASASWQCTRCQNKNRGSAVICYTCGELKKVERASARRKKRNPPVSSAQESLLGGSITKEDQRRWLDTHQDTVTKQDDSKERLPTNAYTPPEVKNNELHQDRNLTEEDRSFLNQDYNDVMKEISRRKAEQQGANTNKGRSLNNIQQLSTVTDNKSVYDSSYDSAIGKTMSDLDGVLKEVTEESRMAIEEKLQNILKYAREGDGNEANRQFSSRGQLNSQMERSSEARSPSRKQQKQQSPAEKQIPVDERIISPTEQAEAADKSAPENDLPLLTIPSSLTANTTITEITKEHEFKRVDQTQKNEIEKPVPVVQAVKSSGSISSMQKAKIGIANLRDVLVRAGKETRVEDQVRQQESDAFYNSFDESFALANKSSDCVSGSVVGTTEVKKMSSARKDFRSGRTGVFTSRRRDGRNHSRERLGRIKRSEDSETSSVKPRNILAPKASYKRKPVSESETSDDNSEFSRQSSELSVVSIDSNVEDERRLRKLAQLLSPSWFGKNKFSKEYATRLVNFKYAQQKRRDEYGNERPWGILGLYEHLSAIRTDVEWAEEVERRKENHEPHISWSRFDDEKDDLLNSPFFTYLLLLTCTVTLVVSLYLNNWHFAPLSENPTFGPSAETLLRMGAKDTNLIVNHGEVWRLITPMFLHAGVIHYSVNMIALNAIGKAVEQAHGFFAVCIIFCLPAIGGTILSALLLPEYISVGASGGIFGLIGACLADIMVHWNLLFGEVVNGPGYCCRHIFVVLLLFLDVSFNCLIGLTPFVDNWTHMGGLVYGMLCALLTVEKIRFSSTPSLWASIWGKILPFLGAIAIFGGMLASSYFLFIGNGFVSPCTECQSLSCVEFPPWSNEEGKWWYCDDCGQTTAEARVDESTGYFDFLKLDCPDGSVVGVNLANATNDKTYLQSMLPTLCRSNCESKWHTAGNYSHNTG